MKTTRTLVAALVVAAGLAAAGTGIAAAGSDGHPNRPQPARPPAHRHDHHHEHGHGDPDRTPRLTARQERRVRNATEKFRDLKVALAAGYVKVSECTDLPGTGGMGFHYLNPALAGDTVVDPSRPELLVYQRDARGRMRLGAVEYFVADADQDLATDGDRPTLFRTYAFDGPMEGHEPGMPKHYDLHVWLYRDNPAGQLAAWNPTVKC
jgi:hypothetical protein